MEGNRNENEYPTERTRQLNLTPIFNIAEICHKHGLKEVVLSPGSRCAPLTLAFTRHPHMHCKTISDERSAAFIALGMAQQTQQPTTLICTSGSATLNYAPAVAEAFFQQIPLLILTADRPPEWIDQYDGQTIRQHDIYGKHVKKSYEILPDLSHEDAEWYCYRVVSEAINEAKSYPQGPVHINIPFREPFYPGPQSIGYDPDVKIITKTEAQAILPEKEWEQLIDVWKKTSRKLIVCGQNSFDPELTQLLNQLAESQKIPIVGDILSNIHQAANCIAHSDIFLGHGKKGLQESLQPELLITLGQSVISKNLKLFLRKYPAIVHWHIQPSGSSADTFKTLTRIIHTSPVDFFSTLNEIPSEADFNTQKQENYFRLWEIEERRAKRHMETFFPREPMGEFELVAKLLQNLTIADLHLANSMAVRYANFVGLNAQQTIRVFSNRGTSGIDGCTSTAVGACLASGKETVLITGDVAFFYDRNAFWHNYSIDNLKIIVLNNHAGGIFRMIPGPSEQRELEEFFETKQTLSAKNLAEEFGISFIKCDKRSKLDNQLKEFISTEGPVILEIESDSRSNQQLLEEFKHTFKEQE